MVDSRVNVCFEGVNLERLKLKQRAFLAMAFGGPADYDGRDLREAHRSTVARGLDEGTFDVFIGHFGARDEVLNR